MGRSGDYLCDIVAGSIDDPAQTEPVDPVRIPAMHPAANAALALLLLMVRPAYGQAPLPAGFLDATAVVDGLVVDMRYFGSDNFVGEKIDGYERPRCLLSAQAAHALAAVQRDLVTRGLGLKVFDCYRPQQAVAHFVRWAQNVDDVGRKRDFYPEVDKHDLFKDGYIAERSSHSRGSTLDLTLVRRADGHELDMGSSFDFFSPKSWPSDQSVSAEAQKNRALLGEAMRRGGFRPYDREWWHFTLINEPFPDTYFDFPVQ
jgi:D-alanyl-D-alanine dipeptidase